MSKRLGWLAASSLAAAALFGCGDLATPAQNGDAGPDAQEPNMPGPGAPSPTAAACERDSGCVGQWCLTEGQFGFPAGYCTEDCSAAGQCTGDATCVNAGGTILCAGNCQLGSDDCREGYACFDIGLGTGVGVCWIDYGAPDDWNCPPSYYGTDDGCDCGCGAVDPDCGDAGCTEVGCSDNSCDYCYDAAGLPVACPSDGAGSCEGFCGDTPNGVCYCDASCVDYGDCCADRCDVCGCEQGPAADTGAACEGNGDCAGELCLSEAEYGLPGGYCSEACGDTRACSGDALCANAAGVLICVDRCLLAADDCRAGYVCTDVGLGDGLGVCWVRYGDQTAAAPTGAGCAGNGDCSGDWCLTEADYGMPQGYCTEDCSLTRRCNGDATCVSVGAALLCADNCPLSGGGCRASYACMDIGIGGGVGVCWPDLAAGGQWTCNPAYYGGGDGCDCGCGIADPDCGDGGCTAAGCFDSTCNYCYDEAGSSITCAGPAGWTCRAAFYGSGDGCDCGCGIPDPDCGASSGCTSPECTEPACNYCYDASGGFVSCDPAASASCRDACGQTPNGGGCYCDPSCLDFGDCCADACASCGLC